MGTSLESLSDELLDRIVSFVDSSAHLALVARISKRCCRVASPHLYSNVSIINVWSDLGAKHLRPFAFLMLQRPDLAALVQSFTLRSMYATEHENDATTAERDWECWPEVPDLDKVLTSAIAKHVDNVGTSKKWFTILRAGYNEAAILALLLPTLVNLRSMDIPFYQEYRGHGDEGDSEYIMQMINRAERGREIFNKLTDVMIPGTDDK
jgi:hypothetical protein